MAAIRGFALDKLASVRMVFSVFDGRAASTRCVGGIANHYIDVIRLLVWAQRVHASSDSNKSEGDELEMRGPA